MPRTTTFLRVLFPTLLAAGGCGADDTSAKNGTTLYVGGDFSMIGGAARNRIAALPTTSATATSWNPNANGSVRALAISGTTLYAVGDFTAIGGVPRTFIAALDTATNAATAWMQDANEGRVTALALVGGRLHAGGQFTSLGGSPSIGYGSLAP